MNYSAHGLTFVSQLRLAAEEGSGPLDAGYRRRNDSCSV